MSPFLTIDYISGHCPVQAEGTLDGHPFYFRARGQHWSFSLDLDGDDPVGVSLGCKPGIHFSAAWGDSPFAAGWMPLETALHLIGQNALQAFHQLVAAGKDSKPDAPHAQ